MAEHSQAGLYDPEHGTRTGRTDDPSGQHKHGEMDITDQQRTFEGFIRFWIWLFGISAAILIFLALFNS